MKKYIEKYSYIWVALLALFLILIPLSVKANHGPPENILPVSKGVYRLPYQSLPFPLCFFPGLNCDINVRRDHVTHNPHNRLDLRTNSVIANIVAAGDGWIEYIQDSFDTTCPTTTCNNYNGPSGSCQVRTSADCNGTNPTPVCRNNYVWIRHPNGEWSKYTHMQMGSVPDNLTVGQFIPAGTVIGVEGDVGCASGVHLHFEVGVPDDVDTTLSPGDPNYDPLGISPATCEVCGFPSLTEDNAFVNNANRQNRIPVFCTRESSFNYIPESMPLFLEASQTYTAMDCDNNCVVDEFHLNDTINDDEVFYRQATNSIDNVGSNFVVEDGGGASVRAGQSITLSPGFHAEQNSFFSASIGACDTPGGN